MDRIPANLGRWTQSKCMNGALTSGFLKKILDDQNLKNKTKQNLSVLISESCVKSIRWSFYYDHIKSYKAKLTNMLPVQS